MDGPRLHGVDDVVRYVASVCFKTGPPGRVGVEAEWHVIDLATPRRRVRPERTRAAVASAPALPGGSALTFEPGGQLELSTACAPNLAGACDRLAADLSHVRAALTPAGLALLGTGTDPYRPPARAVDHPRYVAMERYFAEQAGPAGTAMMTATAALQVCLDSGAGTVDLATRWRRLHALLPVLAGMFANSPLWRGRPTGWRSTRLALWARLDPRRTRPVGGNDPVAAWAAYALDAPVMLVRQRAAPWLVAPGVTFRQWLAGGGPTDRARPTVDDLAYHLTTLFPPVRPHGWLEVRCLDALGPAVWPVAVAVTTALVEDARAAAAAEEAAEPVRGLLTRAARGGVTDPRLALAAARCTAAAVEALPRLGATPTLRRAVEAYAERYVAAGRSPADDVLDQWHAPGLGGTPVPATDGAADRQEELVWA